MSLTIIIPSRIGSTRLPRKALLEIGDKPVVYHVYEKCVKWGRADNVFVATDSEEIKHAVESRGGKAIITGEHENGTFRCFEAFEKIGSPEGFLMNIQGDEPFIANHHLDALYDVFQNSLFDISTVLFKITPEEMLSENIVKASFHEDGLIKDFYRKGESDYGHMGIYGFKTSIIETLKYLPSSKREIEERLEQIRWMEGGMKVGAGKVNTGRTIAIDVLEDYENAKKLMKSVE